MVVFVGLQPIGRSSHSVEIDPNADSAVRCLSTDRAGAKIVDKVKIPFAVKCGAFSEADICHDWIGIDLAWELRWLLCAQVYAQKLTTATTSGDRTEVIFRFLALSFLYLELPFHYSVRSTIGWSVANMAGSNNPKEITSVAVAIATYCFPETL